MQISDYDVAFEENADSREEVVGDERPRKKER